MSSNYSVSLLGPAPWGFRLQGGKDFNMPLTISRLTDGGKAAKAHLAVGDVVLSIDGIAADGMNHLEAQNKIKTCAGKLNLTLQKASSVPKPPVAPKPSVYNTPINLYSNENACEVAMGQRRGLLESQGEVTQQHNGGPQSILKKTPPKSRAPVMPTKQTDIEFYHVPSHGDASKTRIIEDTEDWRPRAGTSQSRSFRILAQITGTEHEQGQQSDAGKKTKRALPLNPLEFLPRSAPCPPPLTASAYSHGAVSRVPIVNCTQPSCSPTQRGSGPAAGAVSPSLLDALLITPISKSPPLRLRKKKRRSASALNLSTSKSEEVEEPQPNAHATCPVKTMVKAPAGSPRNTAQGPAFPKAGGQMGLITPTFGVVSSSCPIAPILDRPVPRPHPKDDDSLVQMAEHIPAGTRTPMCGHCNMVIRGPFLVAMGKSWHPEEFNCVHCRTSLADIGFVEEQSSVYCEHCYEEFFAPSCGRCQHKILGEVINALKQTWHVYCFLCSSCQQPIRNNTFHLEDGEPYCEQDYYNLFGTSCRGCDFPIEAGDKFLEALGFMWHDTCFVCVVCCTSLEGQTFFSKKDKPLCKKHANTVKM